MLLPQVDYYAIQDISDERGAKKALTVIAETYDRGEAELIAYKRDMVNCSVYYELERDEKSERNRYRVICSQQLMNGE